MAERDVTKIRVNGRQVGLVGLGEALAKLSAGPKMSDEEIRESLLEEMAAKNYLPAGAREAYGRALLAEFKRFIGEPVIEEPPQGLSIRILGGGCPNCESLERIVLGLLSELRLAADMETVKDPRQIARYGVLGVPALVINERVRSVGSVPPKGKIREWLQEAARDGSQKEPR